MLYLYLNTKVCKYTNIFHMSFSIHMRWQFKDIDQLWADNPAPSLPHFPTRCEAKAQTIFRHFDLSWRTATIYSRFYSFLLCRVWSDHLCKDFLLRSPSTRHLEYIRIHSFGSFCIGSVFTWLALWAIAQPTSIASQDMLKRAKRIFFRPGSWRKLLRPHREVHKTHGKKKFSEGISNNRTTRNHDSKQYCNWRDLTTRRHSKPQKDIHSCQQTKLQPVTFN